MPTLCFLALRFPERQEAGEALKITPVREAETREGQLIAQGHTSNREWAVGLLPPGPVLFPLTTPPSRTTGTWVSLCGPGHRFSLMV